MRFQDFIRKKDQLSAEDQFFNIPLRKEYLLAQIGKGKKVLDVGCQGGLVSELILKQNNEVWGIELNEEAARQAEKRGIRVKVANAEEGLPFDDGAFDVVHASGILQHLFDTKHFLAECNRVLKPSGMLILAAPNLNSLENRLQVVRGGFISMAGAYPEDHFGDHLRVFNIEKLEELCRETGFRVEEVRGIPVLEQHGKLLSVPLKIASRFLPGLAKLLVVKARKPGSL